MFDYTRNTPYPSVGEPTAEARFREEYHRQPETEDAEPERPERKPDTELIVARHLQRAAGFFHIA